MSKTIFEQIVDREIPADIVYETDDVLAFLDVSPVSKGHTLVIPKRPIENIYELDEKTGGKVIAAVTKISNAIKDTLHPKGLNVIQNNGSFASQSVFHLHFHIIPRYDDAYDGFGYQWQEDPTERTDEEKNDLKQSIINTLNN